MRTASQDPTQPLVYVADNTIGGHQLEPLKKQRIHHLLGLSEGESIEIIYSNNGKFDTDKNVLVGLTNRRIFKIEDEIVSRILISNLVSIRHVENDIFSSDKLHCELISFVKPFIINSQDS